MKKTIFYLLLIANTLTFCAQSDPRQQALNVLLFRSVVENNLEDVKKFIDAGADINHIPNNSPRRFVNYCGDHSALHEAIIQNNPEMIKLLLSSKADIESSARVQLPHDFDPTTPLAFAFKDHALFEFNDQTKIKTLCAQSNNSKRKHIIQLLLEYGANVPNRNFADMIFETQTDLNHELKRIQNSDGNWHQAIILEQADVLKDLISKRIQENINSPLKNDNKPEFAKLICSTADPVNIQDKFGFTPLMWAIARNTFLPQLLDYCKSINLCPELFIENDNGEDMLVLANKHNQKNLFYFLKQMALDFLVQSNDSIPRHLYNLIVNYCSKGTL